MSKFNLAEFSTQVKGAWRSIQAFDQRVNLAATAAGTFARDVAAIAEAARSASQAKTAVSSSGSSDSSSTGEAASQLGNAGQLAASIGTQMRMALEYGLVPINTISVRMSNQFNRVAGTLTELARRIDAALKAPGKAKLLEALETRFPNAIVKLGVGFVRLKSKISGLFSGKVDKKPLEALDKTTFAMPVQGAGKLTAALGSVAPIAQRATGSVRSLGSELLVALGAFGIAYKAVEFFKNGISGAVDLNETMSAMKVTFGDSSAEVNKFADDLASKFGIVKNETLGVANRFGDFAAASKMGEADAAKFATTMTQLAADLSSFKNIGFDEAADKIASGLAGESEPLRRFGVLISETAVQNRALAMGLATSKNAISDQAKVTARAALIQEGLSKASGDLARTQGDAANQFRKSGGGLTNFATSIGQLLLPAVKSGIGAFNELLGSIIETFEANRPMIEGWAESLKVAMDQVGFAIRNMDALWKISVLEVGAFAANTIAWVKTIPENWNLMTTFIGENWMDLFIDLAGIESAAFTNLIKNASDFGTALWAAIQGNPSDFKWTPLLEGFERSTKLFPELIKPALISVEDEVGKIMNGVIDKEVKRAESIANSAKETAKPKTATADAGGGEKKFAGLAERDSKEAYSAILKFQSKGGKDPINDVAKGTKELVTESKKQSTYLSKIAGKGGDSGIEAFAMP